MLASSRSSRYNNYSSHNWSVWEFDGRSYCSDCGRSSHHLSSALLVASFVMATIIGFLIAGFAGILTGYLLVIVYAATLPRVSARLMAPCSHEWQRP